MKKTLVLLAAIACGISAPAMGQDTAVVTANAEIALYERPLSITANDNFALGVVTVPFDGAGCLYETGFESDGTKYYRITGASGEEFFAPGAGAVATASGCSIDYATVSEGRATILCEAGSTVYLDITLNNGSYPNVEYILGTNSIGVAGGYYDYTPQVCSSLGIMPLRVGGGVVVTSGALPSTGEVEVGSVTITVSY